jgi:hypothetical protein
MYVPATGGSRKPQEPQAGPAVLKKLSMKSATPISQSSVADRVGVKQSDLSHIGTTGRPKNYHATIRQFDHLILQLHYAAPEFMPLCFKSCHLVSDALSSFGPRMAIFQGNLPYEKQATLFSKHSQLSHLHPVQYSLQQLWGTRI